MAKQKSEAVLELPVTFGGLSVGEKTCRIGMSISRANYSVTKADKQLVGKRMTVQLLARSNGANADQDSLPGMDNDRVVEAVGDCKGFSAGGSAISFGLTFMLASVDVEVLSHFPKRDGRLTVTDVEAIPDGEESEDEE